MDNDTVSEAAFNLGQIASGDFRAIDALAELSCNFQVDARTRWRAVESLGEIG